MNAQECEIYSAGDVVLDSGATLADARIAYATFGDLNAAGDNAILITTHFGGTHLNSQYLIGNDMAIDPARYFVIVVNLMGNGTSSSPSHEQGANFPLVSIADNVRVQHRLLTESLGVKKLALAAGHSMGAVTTFHWAALFPDFVERAAPICGAARTSTHNHVFLEGMRGILIADPAFNEGNYTEPPLSGLRTMARAWAAWPPSAGFYRHADYASLGYTSVEDYLKRYWESTYVGMDANNVIAQINTWQSADIGALPGYSGDFQTALRSIRARTFIMPCVSDAYFPPEDSEIEAAAMPNDSPVKMQQIFERVERRCLVGHTHVPGVFTDEPDFYPPDDLDGVYKFNDNEKAIINPGSVGQPRDLDPRASYAIYDDEQNHIEFYRLPYDVETVVSKIKAVPDLSDWLGERLREGR